MQIGKIADIFPKKKTLWEMDMYLVRTFKIVWLGVVVERISK